MFRIIKVTGESLSPFFLPGDYVLIGSCSLFIKTIKNGDKIVFNHANHGLLIKEISRVNHQQKQCIVKGSHPLSIPSDKIGPVSFVDIQGKVSLHLKQPARQK